MTFRFGNMDEHETHELIGQILLKTGKIKETDLEKALLKQRSMYLPLGVILENDYAISREYVRESLSFQEHQESSGIDLLKDRIGQLLKKLGIIDDYQINETLDLQKICHKKFGKILSEKNILTENFIDELINASNGHSEIIDKLSNKKVGELLVDLNFVKEADISKALEIQTETPDKKRLGEILIEKGMIIFDNLKKALTIQKKLTTLTCITLLSTSILASCATPRVPIQSVIGSVENYDGSLIKVLKTKSVGSVNYYQDGTVAITNVPFFKQGNDNTCGQAVMASILNYWGKNVSYQTIVNETNPGNLPTDVTKITNYLRTKGLYTQDYRKATLDFVKDRITKGSPPVILLDFGTLATEHYVIATGYNDSRQELIVLDPIDGPNTRIPYFQIEKMWQNSSLKKLGLFGDKYDRLVFDISGDSKQK